MILEFFRALVLAGLPVALASFFLFSWHLRRRQGEALTSLREVERELKREQKARSKQAKGRKGGMAALAEGAHFTREGQVDLVRNKWMKFGGGFYGVVALLTYAVVELGELWDFLRSFESVWALVSQFGLNMLIGLLVEALRNFILAIAWPAYWLSNIHTGHAWLWFLVAYAGYWAGARLALRRVGQPGRA